MTYLRFAAVVCLLITGSCTNAQTSNTDRLVTNSGKLWEGVITYDTTNHKYLVVTKDSTYKFAESEVREIVRDGKPKIPGKRQSGDYDEFETASEPKIQPTYIMAYEPARFDNPDYVIGKNGTVYKGWVLEDHVKDYVIIRMPDSTNKTISYSDIRRINYSNYTWSAFSMRKARVDYLPHLHSVGMGLTISGSILVAVGIPLIASAPYTTTRTSTYVTARTTSGSAVVGVLFELIGVPLLIPGIVKLAKYAHLMKKQQKVISGNL